MVHVDRKNQCPSANPPARNLTGAFTRVQQVGGCPALCDGWHLSCRTPRASGPFRPGRLRTHPWPEGAGPGSFPCAASLQWWPQGRPSRWGGCGTRRRWCSRGQRQAETAFSATGNIASASASASATALVRSSGVSGSYRPRWPAGLCPGRWGCRRRGRRVSRGRTGHHARWRRRSDAVRTS